MTQQEINNYLISENYNETSPNVFVDVTGQFTFVTGEEQLTYSYPMYSAARMNNSILDDTQLQGWMNAVIIDSQSPTP